MTELYLVAHKVRGQPAFDVAERLRIGDEEGWIIPTSGHRAYPWWWCDLSLLGSLDGESSCGITFDTCGLMPPDLEDHYTVRADPSAPKPTGASLLAALGLGKPARPTIARRL